MKPKKLLKVSYPINFVDLEKTIPIFSPREESERAKDKYDKDFQFVDYYTGYYAFGHITFKYGGSESLYRIIDSIILTHFNRKRKYNFLDLGCGVGRTEYDIAGLYNNSIFVGVDYAYNMLIRAKEILMGGKNISINLSNDGFGKVKIPGKSLTKNVTLMQADALTLPFNNECFDCVLNTFLIDRVNDPAKCIIESINVLKKGGLFILTNPLNYEKSVNWKKLGSFDKVLGLIKKSGINVIEAFDNLAYKQLLDARGNYRDWKTLVVYGIKK